ncbi:MAG TPA: ATP-binding protein [Nostocaceae cyanobacterium]|nr:ATP-binding protein [Nostocaceae cyanobacterium]
MAGKLLLQNIPGEADNEKDFIVLKTRIHKAWQDYLEKIGEKDSLLFVSSGSIGLGNTKTPDMSNGKESTRKSSLISLEERAEQYRSQKPDFLMEQLIVPESVKEELLLASRISVIEKLVFDEWGLRSIQPFPYSALNFYGPPGTGKTLAAHAIASHLQRNILLASYAQIESMFHGEGPKNVEALFYAAQRENAVLFIDESDSLLSKRLTNVSQGSEQAINSMRSQLLISLERFQGIVIFATNLVENYDPAFETRVRNIYFPMPDQACRNKIWQTLLPKKLPILEDVSTEKLAEIDGVCGRDIRNAIIDASLKVAMSGGNTISYQDFADAIQAVKKRRVNSNVTVHKLTEEEKKAIVLALDNKDTNESI